MPKVKQINIIATWDTGYRFTSHTANKWSLSHFINSNQMHVSWIVISKVISIIKDSEKRGVKLMEMKKS